MSPPTPPLAQAPSPPPPARLSTSHKILVWLCFLMGITLAVFRALLTSREYSSAWLIGSITGSTLLPFVIAYLIAGRKKVYDPVRLGLWFFGFSFFFLVAALLNRPLDPQKEALEIVRQEMTGQPPEHPRSGPERPETALLRQVLHDYLAKVKAHDQTVTQLNPDVAKLFGAASFAGREAMERSIDVVNQLYDADHQLLVETEQWPEHVEQQVARSSLRGSEKKSFYEAFKQTFTSSQVLVIRKQVDQIELRWRDATVALYQFALANADHLRVRNGKLYFENQKTRTQFDALKDKSLAEQANLREAAAKMVKVRDENLGKLGVTPKDLGMAGADRPAQD